MLNKKRKKFLPETHPHLLCEWDTEDNGDLLPENVTYGSHKRVVWKCSKPECGHKWEAYVYNRTNNNNGCPVCMGRVASENSNLLKDFPLLCEEWDFDRNSFGPQNFLSGSEKSVWWVCSICEHNWKSIIFNRSLKEKGCPVCANQVVSHINNLSVTHPHLAAEWDYSKNSFGPTDVVAGSSKKVFWVCSVSGCGYVWKTSITHRTGDTPTGCPACSNKVATLYNSIVFKFPELLKEWDWDKNTISPEKVVPGSGKKVWWKCSNKKCSHSWVAAVYNRALQEKGCPKCSRGNVSNISQKWLDLLGIEIREHYIKELGFRVDGFDPDTNTAYEFLGDYWHGNPKIFPGAEINSSNKKSFGSLFQGTMNRIRILEDSGFNVVYIWESDFLSSGVNT